MRFDSIHPDYLEYYPIQVICRDVAKGELFIKSKGTIYLPETSGMRADGMGMTQTGYQDYQAYLKRACMPSFFEDSLRTRMGLLHQKPPVIEVPPQLDYLMEDCDGFGTSLKMMMRKINQEQLVTGRIGLALDVRQDSSLLRIVTYEAETIRNWSDGLFVLLDESGTQLQDNLEWQHEERFRLLGLFDQSGLLNAKGAYGVVTQIKGHTEEVIFPTLNNQTSKKIPFVFINSTDIQSRLDSPPLIGLVNLVLTIYRSEADYRQNLFMQGQDTLVIKGQLLNTDINADGGKGETRVGAGTRLHIQAPDGDAKYIGVNSQGLAEQRLALEADRKRAEAKSGELVNNDSSGVESNEAMMTRIGSRTITLNEIAISGAEGLSTILKLGCEWAGANPELVKIVPNMDFSRATVTGQELSQLQDAKAKGLVLSDRSIHKWLVEKEMTALTYEEELELIAKELVRVDEE